MRANTAREAKALGLRGSRRARSMQHLATFALLFTLLTAQTPASHAQSPGTGNVNFHGIADLPTFPCDPGPCTGNFSGTATGGAAGVDGTVHWTVAFPNATMTAGFNYRAPGATCPVSGTASGSFTITGGTGTYGGVQRAASATGTFTWTRTGTAANITVSSVKITIGANVITKSGRAVASFVPLGFTNCFPRPLQAAVAGTMVINP